MEHNDKSPNQIPQASLPESKWTGFFEDFYHRNARALWIVVGVLVVVVAGYFAWSKMRAKSDLEANKRLGEAYVLLREGNLPAAEAALSGFLASGAKGLAADKANLFLGKVYYEQQRYDEAVSTYAKVKGAKKAPLVASGALHGRAAALMQKKDYAAAATVLEELVDGYAKRTGAPEENVEGEEVVDLSPAVPNALFKLALCYRELGQADKARVVAERLARVYPASREGQDAQKLLAALETP